MQHDADTTDANHGRSGRPETLLLRRIALEHGVDPRTILREFERPGCVRGLAGERARRAVAAFGIMGADPSSELAKHVLAWVLKRDSASVSRHEIHRGLHARVSRAGDLDAPIAILVERGYVRPLESPPTGGRPRGPTYAVNPRAER
jgi:hypothetical protein